MLFISHLESEDSSGESSKENLDKIMNDEPKDVPKLKRSAAQHANQALKTLIKEGALGNLDQTDDEYGDKVSEEDLTGSCGIDEIQSTDVKQNGSEKLSQETTRSDSAKEILVCKYQ